MACRGATAETRKIEKYDSARLYLSIQIPEAGSINALLYYKNDLVFAKDSLAITRVENIEDIHVIQNITKCKRLVRSISAN